MQYEANPKHKEPWQRGRRGTLCPTTLDQTLVQQLLEESEPVGNKRYAVYQGRPFVARQHGKDTWHGHPIGWVEVPESLRRRWLTEGRLRRRNLQEFWD